MKLVYVYEFLIIGCRIYVRNNTGVCHEVEIVGFRVSGTDNRCTILNSDVISFTLQGVLNNSVRKMEEFTDRSAGIKDAVRVLLKHVMVAKGPEDGIVRRDLYPGEEVSAVLGSARCVYWNVNVG